MGTVVAMQGATEESGKHFLQIIHRSTWVMHVFTFSTEVH